MTLAMWVAMGLTMAAAVGMPAGVAAADGPWTVASPNGELTFELTLGDELTYTVGHRHGGTRADVLASSPLGVRRDDQAFVNGLRFVSAGAAAKIDETYVTVHGKRRSVHHHAQQQTFTFANGAGAHVELIVQMANDGVAFRYRFPAPDKQADKRAGKQADKQSDKQTHKLVEELTSFSVPQGSTGWITQQQPPTRYSPAYEGLYAEVPAGTAAPTPSGWAFPALFKIADGRDWLLITEADVNDTNCGTRLASDAPGGRYHIRLPEADEGKGVGQVEPESTLPWTLPWRVLIVGSTPATIADSTLVEDVSAPSVIKDTSWIKPGRVSWSWWSDDNSPRNETALNSFTDLAAEMGWEYSLIDANWNLMDPAALQRVLAHAREKHIGMLLWYNSGGPHNDVTEQPRDRMHLRDVRRREFAQLQKWGVKGVKVDFWQSDKQDRIRQYLDLLRDAADFHLMVDYHGCTLPRGWSRTYPHLMTMEAVPGAEQYKFNEKYSAKAPWHNVVLAYTRNVVGGMDYTPVTFTDHKFPRVTSDGHELALSVVFESGLQHFADSVASYHKLLPEASAFLKSVPAAWQDSRFLGGEPGKLAVFARRGTDGWYVGGISGQDTAQTFELDLSFLGKEPAQTLMLITDGDGPRHLTATTRQVTSSDKIRVDLLPRGGFVARIGTARATPGRGAAAAAAPAPVTTATADLKHVLIVMDEREQMETLAKYLKDKSGIDSTIVDQKSVPDDWSHFDAVIGFVHGALQEPVELKIIDYTKNGGRYVCLHHMISSGKSKNKYYFDFLGVRMTDIDKAREPAEPGGHYAWREPVEITVVNLNPTHYITSHEVTWPDKTKFRVSDAGGHATSAPEREYPAFTERGEAYMNVFFSDTDKTVLLGLKYLDDRSNAQYMQQAEGWLKPVGKGWIVYLQPGHFTQEFEQPAVSQMILNAITWQPAESKQAKPPTQSKPAKSSK
jgi:alpha-glucosidase